MKTRKMKTSKILYAAVFTLFFLLLAGVQNTAARESNSWAGSVNLSIPSSHAPQWSGEISPPKAPDYNPDPDVMETFIVAHPSLTSFDGYSWTPIWSYNGGLPGPVIEAEVGDTVIVHFINHLPEETTIHWHGVEVPANMDGSNIAQEAVDSYGYFRYEFKLLRAATFWYHSHIQSNEQVEKGLYGMLVVRDPAEDSSLGLPSKEHLLLLDDILLDDDLKIADPFPDDPLENATTQVNGREGNHFLVNGSMPRTAYIRRDVPHRLRLVNTSNTTFMRVSIKDHRMWRIGGDGGLLETPISIDPIGMVPNPHDPEEMISDPDPTKGILLTPGERADIVFTPNTYGPIKIEWHDIARGRHSAFYNEDGTIGLGHDHMDGHRPPETILTLKTYGYNPPSAEYIPPSTLRDIEPIDVTNAAGTISPTFGHTMPDANGDITFFLQMKNGMPLPFPQVTPEDAPTVTVGETYILEVNNLTGGDHNFHLHGFVFQHIETQFIDLDNPDNNYTVPAAYLEDKDTILLPRRPGARGRSRTIVRLAVTFDDTGREGQVEAFGKTPGPGTSGGWVMHCHILEHVDLGMMTFVQVKYP